MIIRFSRPSGRASGFSLIEVMIAVVVLATGLLALAALQGALARNSAEAKTRSRVAAMLSARMDQIRSTPYADIADSSDDCATAAADDWVPASLCAEAGLGALSATQEVDTWSSTVGGGAFTMAAPGNADVDPNFLRVVLEATWTDAANGSHNLAITSDLSALALRSSLLPPPDPNNSANTGPVVRQDSPATDGVIPIALGDGQSSAASNPTPELQGSKHNQQIVGTNFDVLNYTVEGSDARIQKRFENQVIKCRCQYGAGGTGFANLPAVSRVAQWPAVWTGRRYDVYKPDPTSSAPGQSLLAGPVSGVTQSDLCTECCRDHHDNDATGVAKFDPERTIATGESTGREKYTLDNQNALQIVSNTSNSTYVNSCRMIRVDGLWRTASDMYSRQMGLLETETIAGARAKTGLPTSTATTAYETFVKDYLDGYNGSTGTAPAGAQAMFDESPRGLNTPNLVTIATPVNTDYRYLHDRGLYVDYLESGARTAIANAISSCTTGTPLADCVLPVLPFTTINLTEIAKWTASVPSVINVNSGSRLVNNPTEPSGGRTYGRVDGDSNNTAEMRISNSGVAVQTAATFLDVLNGIDPSDNTALQTDAQAFHVGAGSSNNPTGEWFNVVQSGGGANPASFFTIGSDVNVECFQQTGVPGKVCDPNASASPWNGSIKLSNYWLLTSGTGTKTTVLNGSGSGRYYTVDGVTCDGDNQTGGAGTFTVSVPVFNNYRVDTVTVTGTGSITTTLPAAADVTPGDNVQAETTTIAFAGLTTGSTINVGYSLQGSSTTTTPGVTVAACSLTKSGSTWSLSITNWNVPWD